jgi:hypothetical protein
MADPTTAAVLAIAATPPAVIAANIFGIPVDVIFWAVFGAAIAVTRGPRIAWEFWPIAGAMGALGMSIGVGAIAGTVGETVAPHFVPHSWGLPAGLVGISLGFSASLLAQQIVNRLGEYITRSKLPGDGQ